MEAMVHNSAFEVRRAYRGSNHYSSPTVIGLPCCSALVHHQGAKNNGYLTFILWHGVQRMEPHTSYHNYFVAINSELFRQSRQVLC